MEGVKLYDVVLGILNCIHSSSSWESTVILFLFFLFLVPAGSVYDGLAGGL
jgi:hypothetical protein